MLRRRAIAVLLAALPAMSTAAVAQSIPAKPAEVTKYEKSSPEEDAQAIADAKQKAADTADKLDVKFEELQTDHFIIFTNWDPREYGFLKSNVEHAYTAVARQFELSPKDNIFVGKLPIYMFVHQSEFMNFASKMDNFKPTVFTAGYCQTFSDGTSHMAMWKPDIAAAGGKVAEAERDWGHTLTHEFTHAFIARYKTNENIPRWLNEGIAEVVADTQFPRPWYTAYARKMADSPQVDELFDDDKMPSGEMYPVMMTMAQALIRENPKKFLVYFNQLKDGVDPEKALKANYGVNNDRFKDVWRDYIKRAQ